MQRLIHIDMDAFFASVEQRDDPALRGRPIVVGGSPTGRGVVAAASYEARRFGIHSAMPSARAARLCPHLIFVRGDHAKYRAVSEQMRAILRDYTDLIEPTSVDECYLDVTENKLGLPTATAVAQAIRARIFAELSLTASCGVAPVKFVAKIASDWRKPDGLTVVPPQRVLGFIHPLPIEKLPGVGPATAQRIRARLGVYTIGELSEVSLSELRAQFGKHGGWLHEVSHGRDARRVTTRRERKSRGSERTYETDLRGRDEVVESLRQQVGRVVSDQAARTVTLKIRYADFETITRSETLPLPTTDEDRVLASLERLLEKTEVGARPVRLAGVTLSGFVGEGSGPT